MSYALVRRDELNVAHTYHENTVADIRNDTIHNIVHMVMRLNERGECFSIHFENGYLSICRFIGDDIKHLEARGSIYLASAEQLIDALQQLEDLDDQEFIDDTLSLFQKEGENDAESV